MKRNTIVNKAWLGKKIGYILAWQKLRGKFGVSGTYAEVPYKVLNS